MRFRHITPNVGSEVLDVRVDELTESQREALRAELIDRKVLVVRDQDVDSFGYKSFVETFGEVVPDDLVPQPDHPPELGAIHIKPSERQTINFWHMDYSFREMPTPVLSLCAKELPPCGGDTLWTNLEAAYDGLSEDLKARIEGLETHHKVTVTQNSAKRFTPEEFEWMTSNPPIRHPLVCTNRITDASSCLSTCPSIVARSSGWKTKKAMRCWRPLPTRAASRVQFPLTVGREYDGCVGEHALSALPGSGLLSASA